MKALIEVLPLFMKYLHLNLPSSLGIDRKVSTRHSKYPKSYFSLLLRIIQKHCGTINPGVQRNPFKKPYFFNL
jgi:hypothetical protein